MCVTQSLFYQPEAPRHHSNLGLKILKKVLGRNVGGIQFKSLSGEDPGLAQLTYGRGSKRQIEVNRCSGRANIEGLPKLGARAENRLAAFERTIALKNKGFPRIWS